MPAWSRPKADGTMKAFILDRYGSADRVYAGDVRDPEVREDDVLVEVHAAGVTLLDSKIRDDRSVSGAGDPRALLCGLSGVAGNAWALVIGLADE